MKQSYHQMAEKIFDSLKQALISAPVLGTVNETQIDEFILTIDAKEVGLGIVLDTA